MIEFLTNNWQFVVAIAAGIIELVLMLVFKKRPEVIDNSFMVQLSKWIVEAEGKFVQGSDKMQFVLGKAKDYLGDRFYEPNVRELVEWILSIPEKKKEGK